VPVRETAGTNPHPLFGVNEKEETIVKGDIRMWLVLLEKESDKQDGDE